MTFIPNYDFDLAVNNSKIPGLTAHDKFGENPDLSTAEEDIWTPGGLLVFQTGAAALDVTAGANDVMTTGTGAWKCVFEGLDANYAPVEEEVELNGASIVTTSQTFLRVQRAYVTEVGTVGTNDGDIDAVWTGGSVDAIQVEAGEGQSEHLIFTVPADKDCHLLQFTTGFYDDSSTPARTIQVFVNIRKYNAASTNNYEAWRRIHSVYLGQNGTTLFQESFRSEGSLPEKTDIRVSAVSTKAGTEVFGRLEYFLEDA